MDVAAERNRVTLPGATRGYDQGANAKPAASNSFLMAGMRLPPERFCLTGTGWKMNDEWDSEGEEEVPVGEKVGAGEEGEGEGGEEEEDGKMEDIFGEDAVMGVDDGDKDMTDV